MSPPLRERPEDILPLARHFLQNYCTSRGIPPIAISAAAADILRFYHFPGNARELRNLLERAAILGRNKTIDAVHLAIDGHPHDAVLPAPAASADNPEATAILQALADARWNRRRAAQLLDMPYSTLRYKIDRFGIK